MTTDIYRPFEVAIASKPLPAPHCRAHALFSALSGRSSDAFLGMDPVMELSDPASFCRLGMKLSSGKDTIW